MATSIPFNEPLAYFLTWTTYGTWLPGDERGWYAKPGRLREPSAQRKRIARQSLTEPPLELDQGQRRIVEETIRAHCQFRDWQLRAANCRSNHVHVVVTAPGRAPDEVMDQFKAWCTRKLKERQTSDGEKVRVNWWTQRGSRHQIYNEEGLEAAIRYVVEMQDVRRE